MSSGSSTPAGEPPSSEDEAPVLALERFAALSADIESGAGRDEVIAREGLSAEAWTRAQESWLGKMADEAARKRFDLTNRYNSAFVAQRRAEGGFRRSGTKKKAARSGTHAAADAPPASVVAPPPSFVAAPAFAPQMPSFMVASAPAAPPPPPFIAEPAAVVAAPSFVAPPASFAMPAAVVPPSPVLIHSAPAVAAPPPTNLAGTVAAEMISPFASGAPLPFKQGRAVLADAPPPAPRSLRSGSTVAGVASPFAREATPFKKNEEARPAAPTTPLALIKPIARPAFDPNAVMDLSGTVVADLREPVEAGGKLPFRATPDSTPRPPPPGPPPPPGRGLPFRAPSSPTTLAVTAPAVAAAPAPAPSAAAPRATRFTLEQFASLSAEIAVTPSAVAQVRGRYGLDEASHRAEAEEWGRRFTADKDLFARYGALFQSYRDWLARAPR